ncbi:DNA primase [Granulicella tundricola]|uniref:DNA primase n=1 Tax=Granulicella tundricola (strain ATCC BAA-1859 / DSM 23138 / MP5ACTX9) TaxID=1198114 RepID=E8WW60_GRATM|nr:DNA primase [Granulicella tundricola]ADW67366.1 DNA primase [Granulicella tundricola MP5ACTX9]
MADNFAQTVKTQVDIVKIIGEYVKLRKTGAQNYSGLCPFHKEKTGSFSVNAAHNYFYCFGCHEKGDVFTFVMKLDGLSFPEAVRAVAAKAGIPLPKREFSSPEDAQEAGIRKKLVDLHEGATQYFEAMLKSPGAAGAREYLSSRGVTAETIAKFRMGFAPDDFNDMREKMKPHFGDDVLRASGLFNSSEKDDDGHPTGQLYARFRKRIMFPIANEQGKTIAFTARALEAVDDKGRPIAKYMNSPETPLYTKGNVLFNLDKAKADMRAHDFALLVEGQMDCISVYMAGIKNVIATSGTAFTEMQVRLLSRFTKRVVVNFDPDQAGATAAEKSIALLTEEGFEVKVISLEGGLDPDRFVRENGIQAYMGALRTAKRQSEYLIDRAMQQFPARTADAKVQAMNFLLPHIRRMPSRIHRDEFAADAAQKLGIDSALMRQELKQAAAQKLESVKAHRAEPANETERVLLQALVRPETDAARVRAANGLADHPEWYEGMGAAALFDTLAHGVAPENPIDAAQDDASRSMLAEVLSSGPGERSLVELVEDAFHTLAFRHLERRQRELRMSMAEAQRRGDEAMVETLMMEKVKVDRALREH